MKAVCLLLCLALARHAAGHIFRRQQYYPDMESLIVQPVEYIDRVQPVYRQQYRNEQSHESQSGEQKVQRNAYAHQDKQEKQDKHQQQYQNKQQLRVQPEHDSTSAESHSQETVRISDYARPVYADKETLNTRLYRSPSQNQPDYGDAIAWRGVEIAASPRSAVHKEDIEKIFNEAYKTMKHVSKEDQKIFHQAYEQAASDVNQDSLLNATELLQEHQYPAETHTIKTEDGYYLTLFRIPPRKQLTQEQRPVVFLMHGLLGSADDWLLMGPGKSLAYLLADAGYDVWMGNARGSKYSRRHVSKHPAQSDFWQFSNDEIALQDIPAMIDYALKTSNQQKLFYVGHSQGAASFFALAASRPEYNSKIIMMFALSPVAYMSNTRSPMLRMMAPTSPLYERLHQQLGHGQFKPSKELVHTAGGAMCEAEIGCKNVCSNVDFVMTGANVENLKVEQIPVIIAHRSAGASSRQVKQLARAVASREFTKYDFGAEINQMVYGQSQPPKYELQKVNVPVALYYSEEDWLAHPRDVERLAAELPDVRDSYKVPQQHFANMDFQFADNAPQMVYNKLIQTIQQQASQRNNVY